MVVLNATFLSLLISSAVLARPNTHEKLHHKRHGQEEGHEQKAGHHPSVAPLSDLHACAIHGGPPDLCHTSASGVAPYPTGNATHAGSPATGTASSSTSIVTIQSIIEVRPVPVTNGGTSLSDQGPEQTGSAGSPESLGSLGHVANLGNPEKPGSPGKSGQPGSPGSLGHSGNAGSPGSPGGPGQSGGAGSEECGPATVTVTAQPKTVTVTVPAAGSQQSKPPAEAHQPILTKLFSGNNNNNNNEPQQKAQEQKPEQHPTSQAQKPAEHSPAPEANASPAQPTKPEQKEKPKVQQEQQPTQPEQPKAQTPQEHQPEQHPTSQTPKPAEHSPAPEANASPAQPTKPEQEEKPKAQQEQQPNQHKQPKPETAQKQQQPTAQPEQQQKQPEASPQAEAEPQHQQQGTKPQAEEKVKAQPESQPKQSAAAKSDSTPKTSAPSGGKKGILYKSIAEAQTVSGASWGCNWDSSPIPAVGKAQGSLDSLEFVPQLHGPDEPHISLWAENSKGAAYVMSFNEPNQPESAGGCGPMDANAAVAPYEKHHKGNKAAGQKIISPCVSNEAHEWLDTFIGATSLKPDAVCFHWYGMNKSELQGVVAKFAQIQKDHGIAELWMTEWALNVDISASDMKDLLDWLENDSAVTRYAYNSDKFPSTPQIKEVYCGSS